jgi:hypothetical protein
MEKGAYCSACFGRVFSHFQKLLNVHWSGVTESSGFDV